MGRLKLASAIMGVLIIACLVALIYGISQKAGNLAKSEEAPAAAPISAPLMTGEMVLPLPASAKLKSIQPAAGGGLWIWIAADTGDQLWRLDASGQPVQKIMIEEGAR